MVSVTLNDDLAVLVINRQHRVLEQAIARITMAATGAV